MTVEGGKMEKVGGEVVRNGGADQVVSSVPDFSTRFYDSVLDDLNRADCFRAILKGHESFSQDEDLMFVVSRFGEFARSMGLDEAEFFKDENVLKRFRLKLKNFMRKISEEIRRLEESVKAHAGFAKFSDGWQSRVRKACYYAFFIHYGAKRREESENGESRDYVSHVIRSAFNGLGRQLMFFDEKTFLAAILHDTKEDYTKGILQILGCNFKEEVNDKKALDFLDVVYDDVSKGLSYDPEEDLSLAEMIDLVSKDEGDDRIMALMKMFKKISGQKTPRRKFLVLITVMMVKTADRLDNLRSPHAGGVRDESILIYASILKKFGAANSLEWMYEMFGAKPLEERQSIMRARMASDTSAPEETMAGKFIKDFEKRLNVDLSSDEEFRFERDYVFVFRGIGGRFETHQEAVKQWEKRGFYAEALRRMIICYPVGANEERNADFQKRAGRVLREIFHMDLREYALLDDSHSDDVDYGSFLSFQKQVLRAISGTGLGKVLLENSMANMSDRNNNFSKEYGVGMYGVWPNMRAAMRDLLGKLPVSYFYEDNEANSYKDEAIDIFSLVGMEVEYYKSWYEKFLKSASAKDMNIKMKVSKVLAYTIGSLFTDDSKVVVLNLRPEDKNFQQLLEDAERFIGEFLYEV